MAIEEKELLDYACAKFQNGMYEEALEAFVLAYSKGYEREWVLENVYNCYMAGNEEEFRNVYERQTESIGIVYEDCILDFIPYRDGEYYIFDKEQKLFLGKISMQDLGSVERQEIFQKNEFSAAVILMDWNWEEEKSVLAEARERKIYAICHDMRRCSSYYKIPELSEYLKNVKLFPSHMEFQVYFHTHTAEYLPKIVLGDGADIQIVTNIVNEEHLYRLTPEGRNNENVLLTIAIPTCNRGNLVLKRMENLCSMIYDAEVEFAVSKNGTDYYQDEYKAVGDMPDARINYFDHGKYLKPVENWHYVVEMAHGTYVLMVSDEDDVIIEALEHYFKLLSTHADVSLMRAKTVFQYCALDKRIYEKKGLDAFEAIFLRQNYLSGLILRRADFILENMLQLERFSNNPFYQNYPHEWWGAMLSRKGDYMEEPFALISENESVLKEETERSRKAGTRKEGEGTLEGSLLPAYSTYEARLEQFRGQLDFLRWFMKDNKEGVERGLRKAFGKTDYLLELAREYNYKTDEFEAFIDQFLWMCMEAVDEMSLEERQKINLLQWAQQLGIQSLQWQKELSVKMADDNNE